MPRKHTIWDAKQQKQIDVPFTAIEDAAQDAEDAAWEAEQSARDLAALRIKRDSKLIESDWTQLLDAPLDDATKAAWTTYRQELRDLPTTTADPANPVWPKMKMTI